MQKYDLKGDDVARRLGVVTRRVYGWLSVGQTTPIPTTKLQLLELLLRSQESGRVGGLALIACLSTQKAPCTNKGTFFEDVLGLRRYTQLGRSIIVRVSCS